jgi:hypothetical protein
MKHYYLFGLSMLLVLLSVDTYSQTNVFPASGNVGIGTVDPGNSTLKVYKDTYPEIVLADNKGRIAFQLAQNAGNHAPWAQPGDAIIRKFGLSHSINFVLNNDNNDGNSYFKFGDNYNGAVLSVFNNAKVNINGNVEISAANPGKYVLNVFGKIRANEVVVNTTGADFVFDADYRLQSLAEVESYIKENKHLPGFSSAAEMQLNGMNVSEMQTKLLQKLEEMTLYVIEQNKLNESQSREIERLKQELANVKTQLK